MNAKLMIPAIVAAFGLSSCVVHDRDHLRVNPPPPQPAGNVVVHHDYRPAPKPAPRHKAKPQPKPHKAAKPKKSHTPPRLDRHDQPKPDKAKPHKH